MARKEGGNAVVFNAHSTMLALSGQSKESDCP